MAIDLASPWRRVLTLLAVLSLAFGAVTLSACGDDDSGTGTTPTTADRSTARNVAAAATAFAVVRRTLNRRQEKADAIESELDKANAAAEEANAQAAEAQQQAEDAQKAADEAKQQSQDTSSELAKAQAEAEQAKADAKAAEAKAKEAEAERDKEAARADAAASCAQAMAEIIAEVPNAPSLDAGVQQAAKDLEALAPKCEDSVNGS